MGGGGGPPTRSIGAASKASFTRIFLAIAHGDTFFRAVSRCRVNFAGSRDADKFRAAARENYSEHRAGE